MKYLARIYRTRVALPTLMSRQLIDHGPDRSREFFTRFAANSRQSNHNLEAPNLRHFGLDFIGGALLEIQDAPVATLFYVRGAQSPVGISLLACAMPARAQEFVARGNLRIVHCCSGQHIMVTIGALGMAETIDIARAAAQKLYG